MKIVISKNLFEKYPSVSIGVIIAKNLKNVSHNKEIQNLLRMIEEKIRKDISPEEILNVPEVIKLREIYKSFGAKPQDYRSSIESLIRRVVKGNNLPQINSLVDLYNYISLKYILTAGGEDSDKIEGNLVLDFATGDEEFFAIGSAENNPPSAGEVVYKDDKGVICRCWNWREGDRTKLTEETQNAILVVEDFNDQKEKLSTALAEFNLLTEKYCGAKCQIKILNRQNFEEEI